MTPDFGDTPTSLPPEVQNQARFAAREALKRARLLQPYLANFLGEMTIIQTEEVGDTFAVSPDLILIYNPAFVLGLNESGRDPSTGEPMSPWEYGIAFLHESLHIFFDHFTRWTKYSTTKKLENNPLNRHLWNIAGDCEINVTLRGLVPINPNFEYLFASAMSQGRRIDSRWDTWPLEKQRELAEAEAMKVWKTLPLEGKPGAGKYPLGMGKDWPEGGVSLPEWFCFPETSLKPPQGPRGTAETYFPYVPRHQHPKKGPTPPPPPPQPWEGFKVGQRVVNQKTGEVGVVTSAGPYNPDGNPPQDVVITVTNHWTERNRTIEAAEEIGAVARAKEKAGITDADQQRIRKEVQERNRNIVSGYSGIT